MHKKLKKIIIITVALVVLAIASIIEVERILDISKTEIESKSIEKISAMADSGTLTGGSINGAATDHMYNFIPGGNTFCAGHGWTIAIRTEYSTKGKIMPDMGSGGRLEEVKYTPYQTVEMAQSIAYIRAFSTDNSAIQNIVWESKKWKDKTGGKSCLLDESVDGTRVTVETAGIQGRATQFANFVYRALNNEQKLNLSVENQDVEVCINQTNKTYTVGPYTFNFGNQGVEAQAETSDTHMTMGELVYKEITRQFNGWTEENAFCVGEVGTTIYYENGTIVNLDKTQFQVIDEKGNVFYDNFPMFGQKFYIRYNVGDAEIKAIKPNIQVNYLRKITKKDKKEYQAHTYKSKSIRFKMNQDEGDILKESIENPSIRAKIYKGHQELDYNTTQNWIISQEDDAYIDLSTLWGDEINDTLYTSEQFKVWVKSTMGAIKGQIKNRLVKWGAPDTLSTDYDTEDESNWLKISYMNCFICDGEYYDGRNGSPEPTYEEESSSETWTYDMQRLNPETQELEKKEKVGGPTREQLKKEGWTEYGSHCSYGYTMKCKVTVGKAEDGNYKEFTGTGSDSNDDKDTAKNNAKAKALKNLIENMKDKIKAAFEILDIEVSVDLNLIQPPVVLDTVSIFQPPLDITPGREPTEEQKKEIIRRNWKEVTETKFEKEYGAENIDCSATKTDSINMYIGGNVWEDLPSNKGGDYTGVKSAEDIALSGIQVQLYDETTHSIRATTTTDKDGSYGFQKINPMHKYRIIFTYDGMRYENTKYENNLSGGYSTAQEDGRVTFNDYFDQIDSSPQNYYKDNEWRKAYRTV